MGHDRRPHTRRYPRRSDGTRNPGRVRVNGSRVNDPDGDGEGACCCVMVLIVLVGGGKLIVWVKELFETLVN